MTPTKHAEYVSESRAISRYRRAWDMEKLALPDNGEESWASAFVALALFVLILSLAF